MTLDHPGMRTHPAADLFPLMSGEELQNLADDIKANGLQEPIWLTEDGLILDGRNRLLACEMADVPGEFREYHGGDPIGFSLSMNLKRRHLTDGQRSALALRVLPMLEAEAEKRKAQASGQPRGVKASVVADRPQQTEAPSERKSREKAAKVTGTSGRNVSKAKRVKDKAPDLFEQVESGQIALDRADRIVRDREAEAKRVEQAKRDAEAREQAPNIDLRHGDFRQVLADIENIDAIITDPPYPREYLPLLDDLAAWADKVLTPDGVLAVLFGQTHLPEVYRRLDGHRPYRWTMAYLTPRNGYVSRSARCQSNWKPVLIYGGGPRFADVLRSTGTDAGAKDLHHWGQDYGAFQTLVQRLTSPGQTVADPFMGAGTTLLAAHTHGCHIVGADIDLEHVQTTRKRLGL